MTVPSTKLLLSGDEAVALAAWHAGVKMGVGYPGTPSTEILEHLAHLGGHAQWSPNEKVALEVALGASFGGARALATMKHVGLNVAADPLFTAAYTGVTGALIVVSADDPGMASSQNEQDNRHYAVASALPMVEPSDSQEAYDFTLAAIELSERWHLPVLLRLTTRVCHSKTLVRPLDHPLEAPAASYDKDVRGRVMIPANARPAHHKLRAKLADLAAWNETSSLNREVAGTVDCGIITSGIAFMHAREAAPEAHVLKLGLTYPLPLERIRAFAQRFARCVVIEEGDPWLATLIRAAGIQVESKPDAFRFGELNVGRVKRLLAGDHSSETVVPAGKPPQLCEGCSHRVVFEVLHRMNCVVAGDIGCYTLGVLPPFNAMDTCVCMGASIGVGLGLRHVLPEDQARRVVSVIGDSTFVHSGITGLVEMVYNPPPTGHIVVILDNSTTAMTGHQENPSTGRNLSHESTGKVVFEDLARSLGIPRVHLVEPRIDSDEFEQVLKECLESRQICVIIARRPCILIAKKIREYEKCENLLRKD
jgi:indolepyruvate ferredoxin oxidoreductase, alpha subunit